MDERTWWKKIDECHYKAMCSFLEDGQLVSKGTVIWRIVEPNPCLVPDGEVFEKRAALCSVLPRDLVQVITSFIADKEVDGHQVLLNLQILAHIRHVPNFFWSRSNI